MGNGVLWGLAGGAILFAMPLHAGVVEVGKATEINGMKVEAIYIQSVIMEGHAGHGDHAGHAPPAAAPAADHGDHAGHTPPPVAAPATDHGDHAGHTPLAPPPAAAPDRAQSDIHLEAQIHAMEKNPHGFSAGSWIPYLTVEYTLEKLGSTWKSQGQLIPMASSDGPHYGENVKLDGPGKYKAVYTIKPPSIPYHVDKETGVKGWWETFTVNWEFDYFGTGKKGGY